MISPEIIVIGGGIMNSKIIFDYIYEYFPQMLNKYVDHPKLKDKKIAEYIRAPTVENLALKGAMMLSSIKWSQMKLFIDNEWVLRLDIRIFERMDIFE